jgi:hypothetical protein
MDPTERRLRDADPLVRGTDGEARDHDWLAAAGHSVATQQGRSRRPRLVMLGAAAAAVVLAATAGGFLLRGDDGATGADRGGTADDPAAVAAPTVTDLTLGAEDTMAMCMAVSDDALSPMPVAFSGEVTEKGDDEVLIDVDTWYRGGHTDQVRLSAPDMSMTSLGSSIDFTVGSRYLVTALDGTVSYCGFSGPWTQELADAYAAAFGSA